MPDHVVRISKLRESLGWADRNLHEATLTEWPHMKRNYQEDAEDQQERAQLLDDNLVEIERAIVRLEKRERELRGNCLSRSRRPGR